MGKKFQRVEVKSEYDYSVEEYDSDTGSYIDAETALEYIKKLEEENSDLHFQIETGRDKAREIRGGAE